METTTPNSSAVRWSRKRAIHRSSPISMPSQGPTWNSHWKTKVLFVIKSTSRRSFLQKGGTQATCVAFSVTRLSDFLKFTTANFHRKEAQISIDSLGYFAKHAYLCISCCSYFWQLLGKLSYFYCQHLVTLATGLDLSRKRKILMNEEMASSCYCRAFRDNIMLLQFTILKQIWTRLTH